MRHHTVKRLNVDLKPISKHKLPISSVPRETQSSGGKPFKKHFGDLNER